MTRRLMAVHAHPDDESSKGAATYAYYIDQGVEVMVVSCTGGERGDILNEELENRAMAERDLPGLRRLEMAAAQAVLGVEHRWLGYMDSGMPREDGSVPHDSFAAIRVEISAEPLVRLMRRFRPHVVLTYDENGGYPHPDHIRCHDVSVAAFAWSADPDRYPDAGEPWQPSKLYYDRIFNYDRMTSVYRMLKETEPDSPLITQFEEMTTWLKRETPGTTTTQIPVGAFFGARDRALRAHASQVAANSSFFFWPNELQQRAWPFEDYQLVESKVASNAPETDFFTGIGDDE